MAKDYETEQREMLAAASKRLKQGREVKALKAAAPTLYEIMDGEISLIVNKVLLLAETPVSYDEYLSLHGKVRGIMRIRNLLDSKEAEEVSASQEVQALQTNLKQIEDDKKQ